MATAPSSVSVNSTVVLPGANVTLSWSGGSASMLVGYDTAYCDSTNGTTWGSWSTESRTVTTSTSGSKSMATNPTAGSYRKYRVRTVGNMGGTADYSSWKESAAVRTNQPPSAPTTVTAAPMNWVSGDVTLSWSGVTAGASAIKSFMISRRRTTAEGSWYAWSDMAEVTTSATSGSWTDTSPIGASNTKTQYRVQVKDVLGVLSAWVESNEVVKVIPPESPVFAAPVGGTATYNTKPKILITVKTHAEAQTLWVKIDSGSWVNSVDNTVSFSPSGIFINATNIVYTCDTLAVGSHTVSVCVIDSKVQSTIVTAALTVTANPCETVTANVTTVKAVHISSLRTAVNNVRAYYGMTVYPWQHTLSAGKTNTAYFSLHITEIRTAVKQIADNINAFRSGSISLPMWENMGINRPRAAVVSQLQSVALIL